MPLLLLLNPDLTAAAPIIAAPALQSTTLADITAVDWSLELDSTTGLGAGAGIGGVVQGVADVEQCITIILTTPRGSDILRPDFGADLYQYLDRPITQSLAAIVRDVTAAIEKWEPRARLLSVTAAPVIDGGVQSGAHLNVSVVWELKLSGAQPRVLSVPIGAQIATAAMTRMRG
jgi:phage baseplate assembly protein W